VPEFQKLGLFCALSLPSSSFFRLVLSLTERGGGYANAGAGWLAWLQPRARWCATVATACIPESRVFRSCEQLQLRRARVSHCVSLGRLNGIAQS